MITGDAYDLDFKDIKEVFIMTQQHKKPRLKAKKINYDLLPLNKDHSKRGEESFFKMMASQKCRYFDT